MVGIRTEAILSYMQLFDIQFTVLHCTITIHQRGFAFADGFDFCSEELYPGYIAIKNDILKPRLLVLYPYVALCSQVYQLE